LATSPEVSWSNVFRSASSMISWLQGWVSSPLRWTVHHTALWEKQWTLCICYFIYPIVFFLGDLHFPFTCLSVILASLKCFFLFHHLSKYICFVKYFTKTGLKNRLLLIINLQVIMHCDLTEVSCFTLVILFISISVKLGIYKNLWYNLLCPIFLKNYICAPISKHFRALISECLEWFHPYIHLFLFTCIVC
jgi:hypothetical protein